MHIEICDVTLRDGEQTPGVSFTCTEKMEIASLLDEVGVEVIEAGFPIISDDEKCCVRSVARLGLKARTCALARARQEDVDAAIDADVDIVSIFVPTSDLHLRLKFKKPLDEVIDSACLVIEYARDHGLVVRFAAEDASRTDVKSLISVYNKGAEHGAGYAGYADTVGYNTPLEIADIVRTIQPQIPIPMAIHCHNDMGCATANTLTAAACGAFQLHTTVNGIGERVGNARLEEVLTGLLMKGGVDRYDLTVIPRLSRYVEESTNICMPVIKPIVGGNAFAHESGIHIAAILQDPDTYEYVRPELFGLTRKFILGKHTGTKALTHIVSTLGIQLSDGQIHEVLNEIKKKSEGKCRITPKVLCTIIKSVQEEQTNGNTVRTNS